MGEAEDEGDDLLEVSVRVPSGRLAEFYTLVGKWLGGEIVIPDDLPARSALRAWDTSHPDRKLAYQVIQRLTPPARRMFEILASNPAKPYEADDLAKLADIPNGRYGIAGVLAWPSRRFAEFNRPLPIQIEPREGGSLYSVDATLAPMILDALRGIVPKPPRR